MNEQGDAIKSGSRREFLRGATVAAGGVALIGADLPASAQAAACRDRPRPARPRPCSSFARQHSHRTRNKRLAGGRSRQRRRRTRSPRRPAAVRKHPIRASAPAEMHLRHLGPLHNLGGTWVGSGFNLISLPDFADNKPFRLKLSATRETLEFSQIGGQRPQPRLDGTRRTSTFSGSPTCNGSAMR